MHLLVVAVVLLDWKRRVIPTEMPAFSKPNPQIMASD